MIKTNEQPVKFFEQWSYEQDMEMIIEGKVSDFLKKIGNKVVDAFNKLDGSSPEDYAEKIVENPVLLSHVAKYNKISTDELKQALKSAKEVDWKLDKIEDEKIKEDAMFLLGLGKTRYENAKAGSGSHFGMFK